LPFSARTFYEVLANNNADWSMANNVWTV